MDAYRTLALVEADPLPNACVQERAVSVSPWRSLPPWLARALAGATTLFLLMASASLGAITWTVVAAPARG